MQRFTSKRIVMMEVDLMHVRKSNIVGCCMSRQKDIEFKAVALGDPIIACHYTRNVVGCHCSH